MADYRVGGLDLSSRIELVAELLQEAPARAKGRISELAAETGLSRTWLYELRDRGRAALAAALAPHPPGPTAASQALVLDKALIDRAIVTLPLLTGSVRGIQVGLELLFGVERSIGYISETLQHAGAAASALQANLALPTPVLAEADEIFQGQQPCLTVVDGRSFLVLHLAPAPGRDATNWGVALLDVEARGVSFQDVVCDGAKGIRAGVAAAKLSMPIRPDLFHLLRDAHRVSQHLERAAYSAIKTADRTRRAEREAQAPKRRPGKPLQVHVSRSGAEAAEAQAIQQADLWNWLLGEVRQALALLTPAGRLLSVCERRATLESVIDLLPQLSSSWTSAFAKTLQTNLTALLDPFVALETHLGAGPQALDPQTQAFLVWAWQHRQPLALSLEQDLPPDLHPAATWLWQGLALFHRASSLAESLHSWLRPHLQIHRGMPAWLLPLLQLFWNHHSFQRGKRAGTSPLALARGAPVPSLAEVLDSLLQALSPAPQPA
jgi:hypothetical protein